MKATLHRTFGLALLAIVGLSACTDDAETTYAKGIKAFLRIDNLTGAPLLRAALQSPGMFCTITTKGVLHTVTAPDGRTNQLTLTAVEQSYGRTESICGFIVGTPSVPDRNGLQLPVAFDLACPNCFAEDLVSKPLAFLPHTPVVVGCGRCGRNYDLENLGSPVGIKGRPLYRYHVAGDADRLVIQN